MRMNLDHVASGDHLGRDVLCEFDYWPLAVSMPPTKVCLQCKAAVPVRRKTCELCDHVFRSKRKAECNLREKAMKRMRSVESDSVKSARKAKDKVCERASETREQTVHRQEQNRMHMASMRESAAPRVWHFSAFHLFCCPPMCSTCTCVQGNTMATVYIERLYCPLKFHSNNVGTSVNLTCYYTYIGLSYYIYTVLKKEQILCYNSHAAHHFSSQ